MKKILAFTMSMIMLFCALALPAQAAGESKSFTLTSGKAGGFGVYLCAGESVTVTITQTSPYAESKGGFNTGGYNPQGYKTSMGFSINDSSARNLMYKTFKLNYMKNNTKTFTYKAKRSGMHHFFIRNNTYPKKGYVVSSIPTYRLTVTK